MIESGLNSCRTQCSIVQVPTVSSVTAGEGDLSFDPNFAQLLAESFKRLVGRSLFESPVDRRINAAWLYHDAPFCLLAHDTAPDPCFIYANRPAQACFGYTWAELIGLPSRLSAEAPEQDERRRLLDLVARDGFIDHYRGVRIAKSGRRFRIEDAVVWNLVDSRGVLHGQAATFATWRDIP